MLGSVSEADDALQEAWLRLRDQDPRRVENMQAWLTTIVGRVCLNMLRARRARREELSDVYVPDPSSASKAASTLSRRRWSPTRSGLRCSWCSTRSLLPSG